MADYLMSEARNDKWRAWFTLNGITTDHIVRGTRVSVTDDQVEFVEFILDDNGRRLMHLLDCGCEPRAGHLAKRTTKAPITEAPGSWADEDGAA